MFDFYHQIDVKNWNNISPLDIYRISVDQLPIPENYRIVAFRPPQTSDRIFSVISWSVIKATAPFHELCPRLIVEELEPCELCGEREPVKMTEIKKSSKARNFSIMMLCAGCIESNKKFLKL